MITKQTNTIFTVYKIDQYNIFLFSGGVKEFIVRLGDKEFRVDIKNFKLIKTWPKWFDNNVIRFLKKESKRYQKASSMI